MSTSLDCPGHHWLAQVLPGAAGRAGPRRGPVAKVPKPCAPADKAWQYRPGNIGPSISARLYRPGTMGDGRRRSRT